MTIKRVTMPSTLRLTSFAVAVVLAAAQLSGQPASPSPVDSQGFGRRLQSITSAFKAYVDDGKLSGGVLLVAHRGKVVYHEAFGYRDREAKAEMKRDTIFRIASQTKALVSVAIMRLQEQGKLSLSDPVAKYLPEFANTTVAVRASSQGSTTAPAYEVVPAKRPITIRDLLTHTAGIGYGLGTAADRWKAAGIQGWYFADRNETVADAVARMPALPFDAQPGERFVYGYNTDILGVIIEKLSGQSLDAFLYTKILNPIGMRDTHFYLPAEKKNRLAVVYSATDQGIERAPDPGTSVGQGAYVDGPRRAFSGGAGLLSTAEDYRLFLQMLLNGGHLNAIRYLSEASVKAMTVDQLNGIRYGQGGQGFGFGFSIIQDLTAFKLPGSVGEWGWGGAYHSKYWVSPADELIVVYLTQLIPAGSIDDHDKLRALVYGALRDPK
jgi:CubicO group peptidase (beta-lactamase class C family)